MATSRKSRKRTSPTRLRQAEGEPRPSAGAAATAEMPRGGMLSGETDGMRLAAMPGAVSMTGGMPGETGGAMSGSAAAGEMPRGGMGPEGGAPMGGLLAGVMPSGGMQGMLQGAMSDGGGSGTVPLAGGDMPSGQMSGDSPGATAGSIELPGLWRLTLSQVSGR